MGQLVDINIGKVYNVFARCQGAPLTLMTSILFLRLSPDGVTVCVKPLC